MTNDMSFDLCVVGAGAAGCMAAITAGRNGKRVLLLDAKEKIAAKLYRTGNGKCNLTNLRMEDECFFSDAEEGIPDRLSPLDASFLMKLFEELGVMLYARDGYVYPRTEQASTVVRALQSELKRVSVVIRTGTTVTMIKADGSLPDSFCITTGAGECFLSHAVLISTGGYAGEKDDLAGLGYSMAESFGHTIIPLLPSLVPLYTAEKDLALAAGVRCHACLTLLIEDIAAASDTGQLQIIKQGLSGIPVFQLSHLAGVALYEKKRVRIQVDLLPDVEKDTLLDRILSTAYDHGDETFESYLNGLLHDKLIRLILSRHDLQPEMKVKNFFEKCEDPNARLRDIVLSMKALSFSVTHTGGFPDAQVTSGGVSLKEVTKEGASVLRDGLFFAGEILNVDGICGGYNLTHAFLSGYKAGTACVSYLDKLS